MNRSIPALILLVFITSCSMFFDGQNKKDGKAGLNPLALIGGGTLSDDTAQDQSPFLYRYNGRSYIGFCSDRGTPNDMNLWFAEMDSDGKFTAPMKINVAGVNTTGMETCPMILYSSGLNYLVFLRDSTNVVTWEMDSELTPTALMGVISDLIGVTTIGLIEDGVNPRLLVAYGTTNVGVYTFSEGFWSFLSNIIFNIPVASISGFNTNGVDYYIAASIKSVFGVQQLLYGDSDTGTLAPIPFYISDADDGTPFVDTETYKVYFASTRFGKGNFDLYRYNYLTYDLLMGLGSYIPPIFNIVYVSTSGDDLNSGLDPSSALLNIGTAIARAGELGYTHVYVEAGVYTTSAGLNTSGSGIVITNSNIMITGGFDPTFTYPAGYSELDGNNSLDHIVLFENSADISMEYFVLRNNRSTGGSPGSFGGGVFFSSANNCGISLSVISNCAAEFGGGAAFSNSISCSINFSTVSSNTATNGAGIYIYDQFVGLISLTNINNFAIGKGAAYYFQSAPETVIGASCISNNFAAGTNSVIHFFAAGTSTYCNMNGNLISAVGPESYAIYEEANVINHTIVNNIFIGNGMTFLYRDYPGPDVIITNDLSWTNINDVAYTGAGMAMNNVLIP